jgi:hypothetical protein
MNKFYSRLKLTWFDDCFRAGEFLLGVALAVSLLYALADQIGEWTWLWLVGCAYLYSRSQTRGIDYASIEKYNGRRFRVWLGFSKRRWYWSSIDWPGEAVQGCHKTSSEAIEEAQGYIQYFLSGFPAEPPSATDLKREKIYNDFIKFVIESGLDWSPKVRELMAGLRYWSNGDSSGLW